MSVQKTMFCARAAVNLCLAEKGAEHKEDGERDRGEGACGDEPIRREAETAD